MTPSQFIGQNIHFAVDLFAALACFTGGWLYFDAWGEQRRLPGLLKWVGFFILAVALLAQAAVWGEPGLFSLIAISLKCAGYLVIVIGDAIEPLQPKPDTSKYLQMSSLGFIGSVSNWSLISLPIAALATAGMYWRRATIGLERHLKPLAYTFTAFGLADLFGLAALWRNTDNPLLQPVVAPVGPFWIAEHIATLAAASLLTWWIWRYLTKRLLSQVFVMSTSLTVGVVLLTTMSITTLLYNSLQKDALANLETAGKVLNYAIAGKTSETRANAEVLSQNTAIATATAAGDHKQLVKLAGDALTTKQLSEVTVTGDDGQVLIRASDPDRYGDSLSDDTLIRRALTGTTSSSVTARPGVTAPTLLISTVAPIRQAGSIVGTVTTSLALDNSFVDGIKRNTGLDSAVYSGNIRTATTLTAPDGASRAIGAKEVNTHVTNTTLKQGQPWQGLLNISNQPFLVTYLPLKDVDNEIIGMIFVGQHQEQLFSTAQQAIRLTFGAAAVWLLVVLVPVYFVSRKIADQLS